MKSVYLYITPFFPSPVSWRGAYCYDFVKALQRTGRYDVKVFVPGCGCDYDYQGVHVYNFPVKYLPSGLLPFLFSKWNQKSFLRKVKSVGISLDKVMVCHGHTANFGIYPLAIKKYNSKCLTLLHHHDPASFGLNLGRLRHVWIHKLINYLLLRRMHNAIDIHVFISNVVKKSFLSVPDASWTVYADYKRQMRGLGWLRGVNVKKSIVLHNGVDTRLFFPGERRQKSGGPIIGCVGNFTESKDQRLLLEAAVRLRGQFPELQLRFIGSGKTLADCQSYAHEHRLHAVFFKEVDHTKLAEFYRELDLFILPSYWDGFGCVFTEAWAAGVPFIASDQVGVADLISQEERDVWLVPPQNSAVLAERISYILKERPKQNLRFPIAFSEILSPFVKTIDLEMGGGVMGCVANFCDWKDQLTLLKAVNLLRDQLGDWKLRLMGSGRLLADCQQYVKNQCLEDHVIFEKEVDQTQLPDFYRSLDLFVLPSYFEGFGCVFTEAWACGTPFIACEGQGMDDLILPEERKLWLCQPRNPKDLAEKILNYYQNRPQQHLVQPIAIDELVVKFIKELHEN